jgi:DNA-binding PadR family transcriptional regulator
MIRWAAHGPDWLAMAHFKRHAGGPFGGFGSGPRGRDFWASAADEPPPRAERGEIRYLVLDALAERPRHGYEVIQHIESRTKGTYRPSPGVIYPTLQMLEELGAAIVLDQDGRKIYSITDEGKRVLSEHRSVVDDFYSRIDDDPWESYAEDLADLMRSVGRVVRAFRRGARQGRLTPETVRTVRVALDDALHRIEEALNGSRR